LSAAFVSAAAFLVRGAPSDVPGLEVATAEDVADAVLHLGFAAAGALVVARNRRNLYGWALCLVALCFEATLFAGAYSTYGTFTHPGSLPAPQLFSLLSDLLLVPSLALVATILPLLFPTGQPPTRRWWVIGAAAGAAIALATTAMAIRPGPVDEDVPSSGANPFGIDGAAGVANALELAGLLLLAVAAAGAIVSVVVRTRRSRGDERRQMKIFLGAVALVFAVFVLPEKQLHLDGEVGQISLAVVGILAFPIATALAILRSGKPRTRVAAEGWSGSPASTTPDA
jgi:hypothetical protein